MDDLDGSLPLSSLSYEFRTVLSNLLNTKRVITTDGDNKLPRDWRGLACLLQISSEVAASIEGNPDKTAKILDLWMQRNEGSATLGTLVEYLEQLDRYDVYDDIVELAKRGRLVGSSDVSNENKKLAKLNGHDNENMIITYDDRRDGFPHYYHAYVLFAQEDWSFVRELLARMKAKGYKLCTEYDIDVGYGTQYAPVAQLISERCFRIILVYSPAFLDSSANNFYSDYAQAVGIESNKRNIIPIIYRECRLPHNLMYYHRLVYKPNEWAPYDFWEKLGQTLGKVRLPDGTDKFRPVSAISVKEQTIGSEYFLNTTFSFDSDHTQQVKISEIKDLSNTDSQSVSLPKKKQRTIVKMYKFLTGRSKVYG